jgi:formylglycine-generating enzyme required for sulfatase activity
MTKEKRTTNIINGSLLIVICSLLFVLAACGNEEKEVYTAGRLTVTGLDAYNGKQIYAVNANRTASVTIPLALDAFGSVTGDSSFEKSYSPARISSGQAILKVYKTDVINNRNWENYNGNDQDVKFCVIIVGTIYGFVTVNFVNGIAEGEFEPDKHNTPGLPPQPVDPVDIEMVNVPGGSFQMGNAGDSIASPVHTVTLTGFNMGKYEVTQAQYRAIMGDISNSVLGDKDNYPKTVVSWYAALVFCNRLSIANGFTPAYSINNSTDPSKWKGISNNAENIPTRENKTWDAVTIVRGSTGYRLPTEAQWEYAARGGDGSPGNYTYAGSDNAYDVAWYSSNSRGDFHAVGTKAPNGLGLYDMSGNVSEWCWDRGGSYTAEAQTDPQGAHTYPRNSRVFRGGSYLRPAADCTSTYRLSREPYEINYTTGFRVVRPQ